MKCREQCLVKHNPKKRAKEGGDGGRLFSPIHLTPIGTHVDVLIIYFIICPSLVLFCFISCLKPLIASNSTMLGDVQTATY